MPLRIALVTQAYHPAVGGVTEHVDATARQLRLRGHFVTVVTSRFGGDSRPEPGLHSPALGTEERPAEEPSPAGHGVHRSFFDLLTAGLPLSVTSA